MRLIYLLTALLFCISKANATPTVTVYVFSGVPNPSWELSPTQYLIFESLLKQTDYQNQEFPSQLGYIGFEVICEEKIIKVTNSPALELFLSKTIPQNIIHDDVRDHIRQSIQNKPDLIKVDSSTNSDVNCSWVVGPDVPPQYDPKTDVEGCFTEHITANNCYNYASDISTDTFAQPGLATDHYYFISTCEQVGAAAESDGYTWHSKELPQLPTEGHYVGLFIWPPNKDFHWVRMDSNKYWSHKPGVGEVKNLDNDKELITDPSKSNFSPWTEFCGYYLVIPSQLKIK